MPKEDGVWAVVMFDLPVTTKAQRDRATAFRKLLKANGFVMHQYSVYTRFAVSVAAHQHQHQAIKAGLPPGGEVTILLLSDRTWARAQRFSNRTQLPPAKPPDQLTIF